MNKISSIISLLRIQQWYKNIIIFLGLAFGLHLLSIESIFVSILGFAALCLITSAGYIRNDIIDIQQDKIHPEKCKRPLPSGQITLKNASKITYATVSKIRFFEPQKKEKNCLFLVLFYCFSGIRTCMKSV